MFGIISGSIACIADSRWTGDALVKRDFQPETRNHWSYREKSTRAGRWILWVMLYGVAGAFVPSMSSMILIGKYWPLRWIWICRRPVFYGCWNVSLPGVAFRRKSEWITGQNSSRRPWLTGHKSTTSTWSLLNQANQCKTASSSASTAATAKGC